jgi:hypothetical protein
MVLLRSFILSSPCQVGALKAGSFTATGISENRFEPLTLIGSRQRIL